MNNGSNKDIIALWVGKQSQQCAFNFYNLQAEQIFDEEHDPILHSCIWKNINKMQPRMTVFDLEIQRLAAVRQVNNKKILQKMKKQQSWSSMLGMFGQIDASPLQKHQQIDMDQWPQIKNWNDKQSNYFLINKSFTPVTITNNKDSYNPDIEAQRFATFQQFYHINRQQSQNDMRRQLQKTDFLKFFFTCTDQAYSGFTSKLLQYLKQQCPKVNFMLTSLTDTNNLPVVSLSKLYQQVDLLLPVYTNIKHPYFKDASIHRSLAPYFSSLLTPFIMKQVDPASYVSSILSDNRKLFNSVFTLPIIDQKLTLSELTDIFKYQQVALSSLNKNKQSQNKNYYDKKQTKQQKQMEEGQQFRLNYTNQSYLSLDGSYKKGKFISESYILKGQFKDFQKLFQPKSEPSSLSIKYLQGIFSAPQQPINSYSPFYQKQYGQIVQAYPFHLVMFNHQVFGDSIRQHLKISKKTKLFSEQWPESKQKLLSIADMYLQLHQDSD